MTLKVPTFSTVPQDQHRSHIKDLIKITPQKYIVFQCQDDQPMGQIRITVIQNSPFSWNAPQMEFELMCTNKENYKVSNSKGKLEKETTSHLIRIYIKNIDNLEKCLSDKFRVTIYECRIAEQGECHSDSKAQGPDKHKQSIKIDDPTNNITQTGSRTASIYTNPSIYVNPSALSSTMATDVKSIIYLSRMLSNQQKKITPLQQKEQTLCDYKLQFEESNQRFYAKEKELKTVQNNFQKNKAKQKVCTGLLIAAFLLAILVGFLLKRLIKSDFWHNVSDHVKNQYFL